MDRPLTARYASSATRHVLVGVALVILGYSTWRLLSLVGTSSTAIVVSMAAMALIFWDCVAASTEPEYRATDAQQAELAALRVVALVPAYNEDDAALRDCLQSMFRQTRRLDAICVTDDGSTSGDYLGVRAWFETECAQRGIAGHWTRTPNRGKRQAQMTGARSEPGADIYLTVDSDTVLDPDAVRNGLQPFADEAVQSVAGVILVANYRANLLTRLQELWFVGLQTINRGSASRMGSVMVNSGGCSFYRAVVLHDNAETYLNETLLGRPMHASDDSLLTLFALVRGKTVAQRSCFAFTLMPTRISHHRRQQLRWMRGSTVRSAWRARYLPVNRYAYWNHLVRWVVYGAISFVMVALVLSGRLFHWEILWATLVLMATIQLVVMSPYLTLRRSDQTTGQRLAVYATAPLLGVWQATFLRVVRWYSILSFRRVAASWGTRATVEVSVDGSSPMVVVQEPGAATARLEAGRPPAA